MEPLDVEISIVNHDDRDLVRDCLESLPSACDGLRWHATVIVNLPGGPEIGAAGLVTGQVEVRTNATPLGFGANHNQVLREVVVNRAARYALVLNDDARPRPCSIRTLVQALDHDPTLGAVVPKVLDESGRSQNNRLSYPTLGSTLRFDLSGRTERPDPTSGWLQGCCLIFRVSALAEVGVFDERFHLFFEDTDISRRLQAAGWNLAECRQSSVVHLAHSTVLRPDLAGSTVRFGRRSRYLYFEKYHGRFLAGLVGWSGRGILLARGGYLSCRGAASRSPETRMMGRRMLSLARFNPGRPASRVSGTDADEDGSGRRVRWPRGRSFERR